MNFEFAHSFNLKVIIPVSTFRISLDNRYITNTATCVDILLGLLGITEKFIGITQSVYCYLVKNLSSQVVLGIKWLDLINPSIDWITGVMQIGSEHFVDFCTILGNMFSTRILHIYIYLPQTSSTLYLAPVSIDIEVSELCSYGDMCTTANKTRNIIQLITLTKNETTYLSMEFIKAPTQQI